MSFDLAWRSGYVIGLFDRAGIARPVPSRVSYFTGSGLAQTSGSEGAQLGTMALPSSGQVGPIL